MSQTEIHQGCIIPVKTESPICLWAEGYCKMNGIAELQIFNDTWIDQLTSSFYEKFLIVDDQIWEIEDTELDIADDIVEVEKEANGSYSYMLKFYSGGTGLLELLEDAVRKDKSI